MTLGIIDSGLGGISILKAILESNDAVDIICLADQKNAPYGNKNAAEITELTANNIAWFYKQGIRDVLLACNTSTSVALENVKTRFPDVTITGIIDMTARLLENSVYQKILVLATQATVNSGGYGKALAKYCPQTEIIQQALPELVDMLEGRADPKEINRYLQVHLNEYIGKVDAVVLGCTHYVLAEEDILTLLACPIYDSTLAVKEIDFAFAAGKKEVKIYSTKDGEQLMRQMKNLYRLDLPAETVVL